jgi:hypothetical protein
MLAKVFFVQYMKFNMETSVECEIVIISKKETLKLVEIIVNAGILILYAMHDNLYLGFREYLDEGKKSEWIGFQTFNKLLEIMMLNHLLQMHNLWILKMQHHLGRTISRLHAFTVWKLSVLHVE